LPESRDPEPEPEPERQSGTVRKLRRDPHAYLAGKDAGQREDVCRLHAAWQATFGLHGHKLKHAGDLDAQALADALDEHGEAACLLVLKHAPDDGMVSGRDDEKRVKHESIRYIFENSQTFARILRAAQQAERGSRSVAAKLAALEAAR
jgi:hypothetical protein